MNALKLTPGGFCRHDTDGGQPRRVLRVGTHRALVDDPVGGVDVEHFGAPDVAAAERYGVTALRWRDLGDLTACAAPAPALKLEEGGWCRYDGDGGVPRRVLARGGSAWAVESPDGPPTRGALACAVDIAGRTMGVEHYSWRDPCELAPCAAPSAANPWDAATDAPDAVGEYAVLDRYGAVRHAWWNGVWPSLPGHRWLFLRGPSDLPAAPPPTTHPNLPEIPEGWRWVERPTEDGGWAATEVGAFGVVVFVRGGALHASGRAPQDVIDAVRRVAGCAP